MKKNKLPHMTLNQASDFWDQHDFTEFRDTIEVSNLRFRFLKRKYVGIANDLYEKIVRKAKTRRTTAEKLLNNWLKQLAA